MRLGIAAVALSLLACQPRVGQRLPDFAVTASDGSELSAASLRGHVALLDLWSPGCFACVAELPRLQHIQDELGARGVRVVGLYDRGGRKDGRLIGDGMDVSFPLVRIGGGLMHRLGGWEFPTTLLVDADGRVRQVVHGDPGEERLREMALALLAR